MVQMRGMGPKILLTCAEKDKGAIRWEERAHSAKQKTSIKCSGGVARRRKPAKRAQSP